MLCTHTFFTLEEDVFDQQPKPLSQSTSEHQQLHSKRCKRLGDGDSSQSARHRGQESVEWDGWSSTGHDAAQLDFTEPR